MKEKEEVSERMLTEIEASQIPDIEFKAMVIRKLNGFKAAREKQEVTYKGAPIRLAADFSMETLQARRV